MSNMAVYLIGFVVVLVGLIYGANLLGVPQQWIWVGAIVLAGIGVMSAVGTRRKDPPAG